jgi:hypothetical protein
MNKITGRESVIGFDTVTVKPGNTEEVSVKTSHPFILEHLVASRSNGSDKLFVADLTSNGHSLITSGCQTPFCMFEVDQWPMIFGNVVTTAGEKIALKVENVSTETVDVRAAVCGMMFNSEQDANEWLRLRQVNRKGLR